MSTVYVASTAVGAALHELARHMPANITGQCPTCHQSEPCDGRTRAYATLTRLDTLPHRDTGTRFPYAGIAR
jgi:hypothetical protein